MTPPDKKIPDDTRRSSSSLVPKSDKIKRLTLDLSEELHRAIKKNAAEEGVTMAEKLRTLLMEYYVLNNHDDAK